MHMSERKTETVVENENKKMLEQVTRDFLAVRISIIVVQKNNYV